MLSLAILSWVPVWEFLSLPAKSTSYSLETIVLSGLFGSVLSTVTVKMQWDQEEALLRLWLAMTLDFTPWL